MKVYVVTQGEYSDKRIAAIFDNEDAAKNRVEYIESLDGYYSSAECLDFELNDMNGFFNSVEYHKKYKPYEVEMLENGDIRSVHIADEYIKECAITKHVIKTYEPILLMYCFAKDDNHAVKIVNEKRMQLIAANQF